VDQIANSTYVRKYLATALIAILMRHIWQWHLWKQGRTSGQTKRVFDKRSAQEEGASL